MPATTSAAPKRPCSASTAGSTRASTRPRDAARAALQAAGLKHQILTFTEADLAFFNDTGARFNAPAAEEAWRRVIGWFARAVK